MMSEEFAVARDPRGNWHVAILTKDGRARVDYHGELSDLVLYEAEFEDPGNPWKSKFTVGNLVTDRILDWT